MVLSLDRWVGKIAVVTGASSGIGAAITDFLIDKGINVVGLARRSENIEEKAKQLSRKPGQLYAVKTDMRKEEDIINAFKWIETNLGPIHILINNAGVAKETYLSTGTPEDWRATLEVNVLGLCIATKEAIRIMNQNKINGHIININSVCGHKIINFPTINIYTATKYAVTAITDTIRNEFVHFDQRIKVTSLSPGLVVSEMTVDSKEFSQERVEGFKKMPILKAEDIAEAVGYCLSTPEHVQINELTITPVGEKF